MSIESVAQTTEFVKVSPTTLIVIDAQADGVHHVASLDEWVTVIDGEVTSYHTYEGVARASYNEQMRVYADHVTRNPDNAPGFFEAPEITWEACLDCGRIVDLGDDCEYCAARNNVVTRMALEVGDSEPWPEEIEDIPFMGEPVHGIDSIAAEYGLQPF